MRDRELYSVILGLAEPWIVEEVDVDDAGKQVVVHIGRPADAPLACPECGRACPGYDSQPRTWRHLDTCQFHTILAANVPRCRCPEHGVKQVRVPWAEQGSRFSLLFERLAIDWMKEVGRTAAARRIGITWDQADGIMQRAVDRGLASRKAELVPVIGVDEKSFQGREFVTVVCDLDGGRVLHVADGRGAESLVECYEAMTVEQRGAVEAVAMDMHQAYVAATKAALPKATIVFDRFHIAKLAGEAVLHGVARLGGAEPARADREAGEVAVRQAGDAAQLLPVADQQRGERGGELEDPVDQIRSAGLPEPRGLPPGDLLPLREAGPLPTGNPVKPKSCASIHSPASILKSSAI